MILHGVMTCFNEVKYIGHSVGHLLDMCDKVTVVDNGSTDGTIDVLEELGVNLVKNKQPDIPNVAEYMNIALRSVEPGEYVFHMDADECPSDKLKNDVRNIIDGTTTIGIPFFHVFKSVDMAAPFDYGEIHWRIFRYHKGIQYHHPVHQQANYPHPWIKLSSDAGYAMLHYSYLDEKRFVEKAKFYARRPQSGFTTPEQLTDRLNLDPVKLPSSISYDTEFAKEILSWQ